METATGKFGFDLRNEIGDTLVEWAIAKKYKITNTIFQKESGRRWTWKSPKAAIDYILTNRRDIVTYVTVINSVNTGTEWLSATSIWT